MICFLARNWPELDARSKIQVTHWVGYCRKRDGVAVHQVRPVLRQFSVAQRLLNSYSTNIGHGRQLASAEAGRIAVPACERPYPLRWLERRLRVRKCAFACSER
jgi:hypothetical protein